MLKEVKKSNSKKLFKIIVKRINNKNNSTMKLRKILLNISVLFSCILIFSSVYGATDPTLVTKINSALKKIQGYLVKFSTPAAGVAIASRSAYEKI